MKQLFFFNTFSFKILPFCIILLNSFSISFAQVELEKHQKISKDALWFWYSDPKKPSHLFNRNISRLDISLY